MLSFLGMRERPPRIVEAIQGNPEPLETAKNPVSTVEARVFNAAKNDARIEAEDRLHETERRVQALLEEPEEHQDADRVRDAYAHVDVLRQKLQQREPLAKEDLQFLYDVQQSRYLSAKDSFWLYSLRTARRPEVDLPVLFECLPDQIAFGPDHITPETRVYVGELVPGIFRRLPSTLEAVFSHFPDRQLSFEQLSVGGKTRDELEDMLDRKGVQFSDFTRALFSDPRFTTSRPNERARFVMVEVADLGFVQGTTTAELFERARVLGLELCPSDVASWHCLQRQQMDQNVYIGMEPLPTWDDQAIFKLTNRRGRELEDARAEPHTRRELSDVFLFKLPDQVEETKIST